MVKIRRSFPAPESLEREARKTDGSCTEKDVVDRLRKDFHDKCYICELKGLQDPQVEHLRPHENGKYKDRKFDWNNLFWSCGHCNRVKNQVKYQAGILDCCRRDPEEAMKFCLTGDQVRVLTFGEEDREAVQTAQLVQETYNLRNTGIRVCESEYRLKALQQEMNLFYRKLEAYRKNPSSILLQRTLRALLRRESAFAGWKRSYLRKHLGEFPKLEEYIK